MLVGHLLKTKKNAKVKKETGFLRYTCQKKIDKACFQHKNAYGDFKDLPKGTVFDKVLLDKAFNIPKIQNLMDMNVDFLQ